MSIDWEHVGVFAGQEAPFFSPLSPTSLFSTAYPAFSSSGNLWTWTPEVYVSGRRSLPNGSQFTLSGGILDPFTGETPASEYDRLPTAGERTSTPAIATHASYRSASATRPIAIGAGAYYSKQDWRPDRPAGAWAATADWDVPLGRVISVSGEVYKGYSIAGLGGGLNFIPVDAKGGWVQLKLAPSNRLEFNGAWGGDWPEAIDTATLRRNETSLVNAIYQLRSNVTFSIEYRRLATTIFGERANTANHFSINTGLGF